MQKCHAARTQPRQGQFAAPPPQIVKRRYPAAFHAGF
jgi:hypothetical protein